MRLKVRVLMTSAPILNRNSSTWVKMELGNRSRVELKIPFFTSRQISLRELVTVMIVVVVVIPFVVSMSNLTLAVCNRFRVAFVVRS